MICDSFSKDTPISNIKKTLFFTDSPYSYSKEFQTSSIVKDILGKTPIHSTEKQFSSEFTQKKENKENISPIKTKKLKRNWINDPKARFSESRLFERDIKLSDNSKKEENLNNLGVIEEKEEEKSKNHLKLFGFIIICLIFSYIGFVLRGKENVKPEKYFCNSQNKQSKYLIKECEPCPENAFCFDGKMVKIIKIKKLFLLKKMCLATFIQKENDKYTCISNKKIPENAKVFLKVFFKKDLMFICII